MENQSTETYLPMTSEVAIAWFEFSGMRPANDAELVSFARSLGFLNDVIAEIISPLRQHFGIQAV